MSEQLTPGNRFRLYGLISEAFDLDELKRLSFRLGIDDEDLPQTTKSEFIRAFIAYCQRRGRLNELLSALADERPTIVWVDLIISQSQEHFPVFYQEPGVVNRPPQFFGRRELLAQISALLNDGRQVLLHGLIGSGKSALAAQIADDYLRQGQGRAIWFTINDLAADAIFDALAQRLGTREEQQEIQRVQNEADLAAVRTMLGRYRPVLLVLDNARNGAALRTALQALPPDVPALVTSELVFSLPELVLVAVGDLPSEEALNLLSYYAGRDYTQDKLALELCRALAYHPYSLKIGAAGVKADGRVRHRWLQMITQAPTDIAPPFEDRPALAALLQQSYTSLTPTAQAVFRNISGLFVPGATPELLALCLSEDVYFVWKALDELVYNSLSYRQPIDWLPAGVEEIEYYAFHELTYRFGQMRFQEQLKDQYALLAFVRQYTEQFAEEPARLRAEIGNILAAARTAQQRGDDESLVAIVSTLALFGYMDTYGHTREYLELLDTVIDIVRSRGAEGYEELHYLVGKRGNAYLDRGQLDQARQSYEEALELAPTSRRQVMALGVLGKVCYQLEDYQAGDDYFARGHQTLEAKEDELALGFLWQQQSAAKGLRGDHEAARNFAKNAVYLNRPFAETNAPRLLFSLLNLGTAEARLGNLERAVEIHQEGYEMALEKGHKRLAADMLFSLAQDLYALHRNEQVIDKLEKARRLYHDVGDVAYEQDIIAFIKNLENQST